MGLKAKFTKTDVENTIQNRMNAIENRLINRLKYMGELCVIQARAYGSYRDITGNLRNSVGYVVLNNGQIISEDFSSSDSTGAINGKKVALQAAMEHPFGYALIVVAGMNYAASVESRGRDVLTSAELLAEKELPKLLSKLR